MSLDLDKSFINTGMAAVAGRTVTGFGVAWTGIVRKGDLFGTHRGSGVRIESVNEDGSLTLAYDVDALQQSMGPYEIQRTPYDLGYYEAIEELLARWAGGNVDALADLAGSNGKLPMFTGPGAMTLIARSDIVSPTRYRGAWKAEDAYDRGDVVRAAAGLFISKTNGNSGHAPDSATPGDTDDWMYAGAMAGVSASDVLGELGVNHITISPNPPSGGSENDIWFQY